MAKKPTKSVCYEDSGFLYWKQKQQVYFRLSCN